MTTTPEALAAEYVGRHQLSPDTAADMTEQLAEWMTHTTGMAAQTEREKLELALLAQVYS